MQWMVQDSSIPWGCVDDNGVRLVEVLTRMGKPFTAIGMIPFTHEVTGLQDTDPAAPTLFYCSVQTAQEVAKWDTYRPGVFWDDEWWDPRNWVWKRSDLLNEDMCRIQVKDVRAGWWVDKPMFVKSVGVKALTGQVWEPEKADRDNWIIEHAHLDPREVLLVSPIHKLDAEWRFFVVNGEVITGGIYRRDGVRVRNAPVDPKAWDYARQAVKEWMPSPNIVMDIALTRNQGFKVVEFNCLNSSGFYRCDLPKLVDALEANRSEK